MAFDTLYRSSHPLALEKSLISRLETERKKNPIGPIFVLVPNHYVGAHLKHELATRTPHVNIFFETLGDFAVSALSDQPIFLKKKKLTDETELFHIGQIAQQHLRGTEFEAISKKLGFHKNLQSLFHHLISFQVTSIPHVNSKTKSFDVLFSKYLKLKDVYHHNLWNLELATRCDLKFSFPVFVYGFPTFSKLEQAFLTQVAKHAPVSVSLEVCSSERFQQTTFEWLDRVFSNVDDLESVDTKSNFVVQPCYHFEDEASYIAQTMIDRQKIKPISFHRFGIFLNDYEAQEPYVRKTLNQFGIPHVSILGVHLETTRFGVSFISLIRLLLKTWDRAEWFGFLQSYPFDSSITLKYGKPSDWTKISVEAGVSTRDASFIQRLERFAKSDEKVLAFVEFQKKILKDFANMETAIKQTDYVGLVTHINRFFQEYASQEIFTSDVLLFLDELTYVCNEIKTTWEEAQTLILSKLDQTYFGEKIFETDGVLIAPISMMKSLFFDVLFLPHLNEGKFPKSTPARFDLHLDEMKMISSKSPVRFESNDAHDEQLSWFDSAKDHCTEMLHMSYSMYSLPKEDDLKPSLFLHGLPTQPVWLPKRSRSLPAPTALRGQIQKWIAENQSQTWSQYNAMLDPSFVSKEVYSVSELTKYATCPKQYFFSYVLGLAPEDYLENEFQMMPKDKGKLVHDILFRFFTQAKQKAWIPLTKQNRDSLQSLMASITRDVLSYQKTFGSYGITRLWEIDEIELLSNLSEYLDQEIREAPYWIPFLFEHSFEKPLSLSPLQKQILFKGRVDRIDVSPDRKQLRITDYKTGNLGERKSWGFDKGTQLQVPVYMLLADQFFPNDEIQEVHGKLLSIQSISKFDQRSVTKTEILSKHQELSSHVDILTKGIESGNFFPNPGENGKNCRYCDFINICGSAIHQKVEEMEETPFMARYQESKKALP